MKRAAESTRKPSAPDYKRLTFPQLRSFCEVARCGSMKAAAERMEVAQPTVWKQIHALEKTLGVTLIESHPRGTELAEAGRLLLALCGPAVNELGSIEESFAIQLGQRKKKLVVATTPRLCRDDLPECLSRFNELYPTVQLHFVEVAADNIVRLVEKGEADIGLSDLRGSSVQEELKSRPCYEVEPVLAVPLGHPLSKKKRVRLEDLKRFPLLNARSGFPNEQINAALNRAGAYDNPDRCIELSFAQTILRYVQLGHGIGLVGRAEGSQGNPPDGVTLIPMGSVLPTIPVRAIFRARLTDDPIQSAFIDLLRSQHSRGN